MNVEVYVGTELLFRETYAGAGAHNKATRSFITSTRDLCLTDGIRITLEIPGRDGGFGAAIYTSAGVQTVRDFFLEGEAEARWKEYNN